MGQFWGGHRDEGAGRRRGYRRKSEKCLDMTSCFFLTATVQSIGKNTPTNIHLQSLDLLPFRLLF